MITAMYCKSFGFIVKRLQSSGTSTDTQVKPLANMDGLALKMTTVQKALIVYPDSVEAPGFVGQRHEFQYETRENRVSESDHLRSATWM